MKRFLKGLVKRYVNLAMLADQPFDTMVNRAHQVEMRYEVEGNAKSKKYKTEGQSSAQNLSYNGAFHMGSSGGPSQSSHKTSLNNLNKGDIDTRVEVIDKVIALIVVGRIVDRVVQGQDHDQLIYHVPSVAAFTKAPTSCKPVVVSNIANKVILLGNVLFLEDNSQNCRVLWPIQLDLDIQVLLDLLAFNLKANRVEVLEVKIQVVDP